MTDICFIYLPHPYLKRPDAQLPMGILMLAAVIKQDGRYSVEVKNYSSFTMEQAIGDLPEAKIYGITATSMEIPYANEFAKGIKNKYRKSWVIIGGPCVQTEREYFNFHYVDGIIYGESELDILDIIDVFLNDKKRLETYWFCETPIDMDSLPFPAREMLDQIGGDVFAYNKNYFPGGSTAILSSRGCPFDCAFCSSPSLNHRWIRYRNPENVVQEITHVISEYGIKQFRFSDDMFTADRKRVFEICELIGPLDIAWRISTRVKPIDIDMLQTMKDAGCKEISFGVESFDNKVLKLLNKKTCLNDNIRALELADKVGIDSRILLMIGTPGQTPRTIRLNKQFIDLLPHTIVACTSFVPLPGSDIWDNPDKYGIEILSRDMRDYNFYFFGADGANELKSVIKLKDRLLDEFMAETQEFREWLFAREDVNKG